MDDLLRYLLQEGNVLDIVDLCGEDALKDMWIELITYLSSMENSPTAKDQLIALLEKFVSIFLNLFLNN
jgi:hypothetical protein